MKAEHQNSSPNPIPAKNRSLAAWRTRITRRRNYGYASSRHGYARPQSAIFISKAGFGMSSVQLAAALALITLGVALRLLPHPANFAPIAAIAIFGGAVLPRKLAIWVPLGAMMVSDLFIGFYTMMPVTWACYLLIALASSVWLRKSNLLRGAALTLASSLFFFVVTNFAVWLTSGMYVHTWAGFIHCYVMALPFFRNTAMSDLLYTAMLFGLFALAGVVVRSRLDGSEASATS